MDAAGGFGKKDGHVREMNFPTTPFNGENQAKGQGGSKRSGVPQGGGAAGVQGKEIRLTKNFLVNCVRSHKNHIK